uniref:AlNc14C80G5274 protein n=1 Tax=Albugo laibachii Nc14 TaxID=890382 RepID=F0WF82_9STRA|nr:AlNc14C80G5274 [Albugo laibachii Nc14]|eukprot:CCA19864.1 AlNc14C80G5274 [Albugo laibachii Nc14]
MSNLTERDCRYLSDYVSSFRHVVTKVREMSELDPIMYFLRGVTGRTWEEIPDRRSTTLSDAITVALGFDRSHLPMYSRKPSHDRPRYRSYENSRRYRSKNSPDPMDISNAQILSGDECHRRNS